MDVETIRMSSKGQVVIPQQMRDKLHAVEGTLFAVVGGKDSIILKKIITPSKEDLINELTAIAKEGKKRLQKKGISEEEIPNIVGKARAK